MTSSLHNRLCDELGIKYPIFLAGMGSRGRATPPALVAAVSEAGGLGVLGGSAIEPGELRDRIRAVRQLTKKPFGVGLLLPASMANNVVSDRVEMRARIERDYPQQAAFVRSLLAKFGLSPALSKGEVMSPDFIRAQVDVCLEERIAVFSAGLGSPEWLVPDAKKAGIKVMGLVGSVRAAKRQAAAGVDYIIAQGSEAGGHTGTVGSLPLIPAVVDAVSPIPVIAAGGIADGRAVVAAMALGAVGAWIGTAFLLAEESEIYPAHQEEIMSSELTDFVVTRSYTGKTARDFKNPVIDAWEKSGLTPLPMPLQGILMGDFSAAALAAGRIDLINNPSGQSGGLLNRKRPAAEIFSSIVAEAEATIKKIGNLGN